MGQVHRKGALEGSNGGGTCSNADAMRSTPARRTEVRRAAIPSGQPPMARHDGQG